MRGNGFGAPPVCRTRTAKPGVGQEQHSWTPAAWNARLGNWLNTSKAGDGEIPGIVTSQMTFRNWSAVNAGRHRRSTTVCRETNGCWNGPAGQLFDTSHGPNTLGDLTRGGFRDLGCGLAAAASPVPVADGLSDQFDAMSRPTPSFEAHVDVGSQSGHSLDPSEIGDDSPPLGYLSRRGSPRPPSQVVRCTAQEFDPVNVLTSRQMLKLPAESPQIPRPNQAIHRRGGGERESEAESTPATR